jgi:hypothetical protein
LAAGDIGVDELFISRPEFSQLGDEFVAGVLGTVDSRRKIVVRKRGAASDEGGTSKNEQDDRRATLHGHDVTGCPVCARHG